MILIIDNYDSFTYNLYQSVAIIYKNTEVIRNDKIDIKGIKQLNPAGIILSPGPGNPENAGICVEVIRTLISGLLNTIPLLGICLGHQAIAVALGGQVVQANEICHGKSDYIFHRRKNIYQQLSLPFQAGRYHSLMVDRNSLPPALEIEAENANGLLMGIQHTTLPIMGVQFHPESILTPEGYKIIQHFVQLCLAPKNNQVPSV